MLFNGNIFPTNQLSKTYIITNLIYKSPEFLILCYLLFIFFIMINKKYFLNSFNFFWSKIFLLLLIFLFPLIYFIFLPFRIIATGGGTVRRRGMLVVGHACCCCFLFFRFRTTFRSRKWFHPQGQTCCC